ncbi:LD-carboxypeptidase [Clostridium sp. AL.422]|uniref:S66 peptidase family protein n=1 Tax=Clostridium TaxID=1485 RepID=UPI00293DCD27|nr:MULTISPECIES: LD-carboxypeptidase [unclassified Clostridium]MDV4152270.1 LD-carboxypeptidase [Clostridium sp. AL.422]
MFKTKLKVLTKLPTIGIVAPASPESKEYIDEKISIFKELGFKIKKGEHLYDNLGYLAGNDKDRASDLNSMFKDKEISAIICLRGGYGSIRMAPYLDLKTIKSNPKPFFGYSDITLLLNYIYKRCNFPTFHGPMITSNFNDIATKEYFLKIINHDTTKVIYDLNDICHSDYLIWNNKDFSGNIVGGNLSLICSTIGTPYEIEFNNNILLVEDVNESPYSVDRMLSQLISCGKLKKTSGILIGNFTNCTSSDKNLNVEDIIKERLIPLGIPILCGLNIGHDYPNITIPIGSKFKFSSKENLLIQKEIIFK